jgi:folate-binding protein YgfZ
MGSELTNKTIAAEAGLVERTVNFTKGCYTGQELVARIDSRGSNVARRLVGVVAPPGPDEPEALAPGMTLHAGAAPEGDAPAEDKVVGTLTSAAWSAELRGWVGLGYLQRKVDSPGPVRVRAGDGIGGSHPARVSPLPLDPGQGEGATA